MKDEVHRFEVEIDFENVLRALSAEIYSTPYAFLRENLQNAVDACRIQALRQKTSAADPTLRIDIIVEGNSVQVHDRGIGMSAEDLRNLFWRIGASGKRTEEALEAGCVGRFGIGGFANFGVCDTLIITSQAENHAGHRTELSRSDIEDVDGMPKVTQQPSDQASPRGTIVEGILNAPAQLDQLLKYAKEIVRFCREPIYFNGSLISGDEISTGPENRIPDSSRTWSQNGVSVTGAIYEASGKTLAVTLEGLSTGQGHGDIFGTLRFEGSGIDILRRGFKLCSISVATGIGVSGFIDCSLFSPTAGRDTLNSESSALVSNMVAALEHAAVLGVLESSELIDQHTRIFRYVRSRGLVDRMGNVTVQLAHGDSLTLEDIREQAAKGSQVYFATTYDASLANILYARGHLVVALPSDRHKAAAIQDYLSSIGATHLEGHVECKEEYIDLSRFEKAFLGELSETIADGYQVQGVKLIPGSLTEDIPATVSNAASRAGAPLHVYIDTRHVEIQKLARLGMTSLFRSMVSAFCREYLGPVLRSRSPKFFGSGAVNLDWLVEHQSEAWILLTSDIAVVNRSPRPQVVTVSDIQVITTSPEEDALSADAGEASAEPKLVKIEGGEDFEDLNGYYLRVPNGASLAFGDLIVDLDDRGAIWMGNRISLVASDAISTAFHFDIQLRRLLVATGTGLLSHGAVDLDRPIQRIFGGLYFPVPSELEEYLVPTGNQELHIRVQCDLVDFAGSRGWEAREEPESRFLPSVAPN